MHHVLTVGSATQDIIVKYKEAKSMELHTSLGIESYLLLEEGKKIESAAIHYQAGGGATNAATCFHRLGFNVSVLSKIGTDTQGDQVLQMLSELGVGTQLIKRDGKLSTGVSLIIPSLHGDGTVFTCRGASTCLSANDIPYECSEQFKQLYITSLSGESAQLLPNIAAWGQSIGAKVAVNPGSKQLDLANGTLQEAMRHIDVFMLNFKEAKHFMANLRKHDSAIQTTDSHYPEPAETEIETLPELLRSNTSVDGSFFSLKQYFREILKLGPKIITLTNGKEGVYAADNTHIYYHAAIPTHAVNSTGAGDAFGSSFIASLLHNPDIGPAIRCGAVNAASVVGFSDAKSGLLSKVELELRVSKLDPKLLRIITF